MQPIILDFVEVILPLPLERNFTYAITAAEAQFIKPGFRVAVPFGKRNVYTGVVYKVHQEAPTAYEAKSIHSILDKSSVLNFPQFQLWEWISSYYMCTMGEVLRASLPSVFLLESETLISLNKSSEFESSSLSDEEYLVFEALQQQSSLKIDEINTIINKKNAFPVLQRLLDQKAIVVEQEVLEKYKPKLPSPSQFLAARAIRHQRFVPARRMRARAGRRSRARRRPRPAAAPALRPRCR